MNLIERSRLNCEMKFNLHDLTHCMGTREQEPDKDYWKQRDRRQKEKKKTILKEASDEHL